jgi:hypothetical protein
MAGTLALTDRNKLLNNLKPLTMLVKFMIEATDLNHIKSICYNDAEHTEESIIAKLVAVHPVTDNGFRYVEIEIKHMEMFLMDLLIQGKRIGAKHDPIPANTPLPF